VYEIINLNRASVPWVGLATVRMCVEHADTILCSALVDCFCCCHVRCRCRPACRPARPARVAVLACSVTDSWTTPRGRLVDRRGARESLSLLRPVSCSVTDRSRRVRNRTRHRRRAVARTCHDGSVTARARAAVRLNFMRPVSCSVRERGAPTSTAASALVRPVLYIMHRSGRYSNPLAPVRLPTSNVLVAAFYSRRSTHNY